LKACSKAAIQCEVKATQKKSKLKIKGEGAERPSLFCRRPAPKPPFSRERTRYSHKRPTKRRKRKRTRALYNRMGRIKRRRERKERKLTGRMYYVESLIRTPHLVGSENYTERKRERKKNDQKRKESRQADHSPSTAHFAAAIQL
jgi:hypothetical protein